MSDAPNDDLTTLMRSRAGTAFIMALGAEIVDASVGKTLMRLPYSKKLVGNPDTGVLHGGVITALLDHACGMAVGSGLGVIITDPQARLSTSYATLDLRVDYMKAARPDADVFVIGECVKITRQIVFARGRAYQEAADDPIATAAGTFITTQTRAGELSMEMLARAAREGRPVDVATLLAAVPYCEFLGVTARLRGEEVILEMPFDPKLVGNPHIPALHGGVIGSLLETAAIVQAVWDTKATAFPKPVDITVDYLRTGRAVTTYAGARLARQGRRVVSVHAQLWQEDEAKPIAALRGHFLLASS